MNWDDAMSLDVPLRKWLIKRWNKQKETEQKGKDNQPSTDQPLTEGERRKMIMQQQGSGTKRTTKKDEPSKPPMNPKDFMTSMRNNS